MTINDFAKKLDGRKYRMEMYQVEANQAKQLGFVVLYGYSDDIMRFRGAIDEEVGCFKGKTISLNKNGIIEDCECECRICRKAIENELKDSKEIKAIWCRPDIEYSWIYETDIPHVTFDIFEADGDLSCRGIVFDLNNLDSEVLT
jgi:hypothetical protein